MIEVTHEWPNWRLCYNSKKKGRLGDPPITPALPCPALPGRAVPGHAVPRRAAPRVETILGRGLIANSMLNLALDKLVIHWMSVEEDSRRTRISAARGEADGAPI
jgi:hypothetical protein